MVDIDVPPQQHADKLGIAGLHVGWTLTVTAMATLVYLLRK